MINCGIAVVALLGIVAIAVAHSMERNYIEEFRSAFAKLDRDHDGIVTNKEASLGLVTTGVSTSFKATSAFPAYPTRTQLCSMRVPDAPVFIDCVVATARWSSKEDAKATIVFEEAVDSFFGECSDTPPPSSSASNKTCYGLIGLNKGKRHSSSTCSNLVKDGFCLISCRSCDMSKEQEDDVVDDRELKTNTAHKSSISAAATKDVPLLLTSDWHAEPWYEIDSTASVARCTDEADDDNMWTCFKDDEPTTMYTLTGASDPPIAFIASHLEAYSSLKGSNNAGLVFYMGDTQAHDFEDIGEATPSTSINALMDKCIKLLLQHFDADNIFVTAGNNDGPHNEIFASTGASEDEETLAWANAMLSNEIVNNELRIMYEYPLDLLEPARTKHAGHALPNDLHASEPPLLNQVDFFSKTGYYMKKVDPTNKVGLREANLFVIHYNTNLGATNSAQSAAFLQDLEFISSSFGSSSSGFFLLGHHPETTKVLVPKEYQFLMKGSFSGHVHYAQNTVSKSLFTQVSAISQDAQNTAFFSTKISSNANYVVSVNMKSDLYSYDGPDEQVPDAKKWVVL